DFLARDGLHWGVNMYAYEGERNIGDLRIWRGRGRDNFNRDTLELLEMLRPAFTQALIRARTTCAPVNVSLTLRERGIADLVCAGLSDKEIAQRLGIEFSTVRTHMQKLFEKHGVHSRSQLQTVLFRR
ncbi:MAG: helix-turn-helix transcriptional regulator, partial [Gallionellaceae bacterium]|nr:helix-turn-helix transcriptional regulator [Gallionellaceae bacterium]